MIDRLRGIWLPGIRMQLMLWYTSIFALLLILFSIIFYFTLQSALAAAIDADLKIRTQQVVAAITNDKGIINLTEVVEELRSIGTSPIPCTVRSITRSRRIQLSLVTQPGNARTSIRCDP